MDSVLEYLPSLTACAAAVVGVLGGQTNGEFRKKLIFVWLVIGVAVLAMFVQIAVTKASKDDRYKDKLESTAQIQELKAAIRELKELISPAARTLFPATRAGVDDLNAIPTARPEVVQPQLPELKVKEPDENAVLNQIVVYQDVKRTIDNGKQHTVTLTIDVTDRQLKDKLFSRIDRVVYRLDPRWYSKPVVELKNPSGNYAYSFGAFGSTSIVAEIFLKNPDARVIRQGKIDLTVPQVFGPT